MTEPIDLDLTKTIGSAINAGLQSDVVKVALSAFIEGRGLEGEWRLEITGARLVPMDQSGE